MAQRKDKENLKKEMLMQRTSKKKGFPSYLYIGMIFILLLLVLLYFLPTISINAAGKAWGAFFTVP